MCYEQKPKVYKKKLYMLLQKAFLTICYPFCEKQIVKYEALFTFQNLYSFHEFFHVKHNFLAPMQVFLLTGLFDFFLNLFKVSSLTNVQFEPKKEIELIKTEKP